MTLGWCLDRICGGDGGELDFSKSFIGLVGGCRDTEMSHIMEL